jgi:hypothetical protein
MDESLRRQGEASWAKAEARSLDAATLEEFLQALERGVAGPGHDGGLSQDDVEWFRLFLAVQRKIESCRRGDEFGLPDGDWRSRGIQFEKMEEFYEGLERVGAIRRLTWFLGGGAYVDATDLRPIRDQLSSQVLVKLREIGLEPLAPHVVQHPGPSDEIKTKGPRLVRRLLLRIGDTAVTAIVTAIMTAIVGWLLLEFGFAG